MFILVSKYRSTASPGKFVECSDVYSTESEFGDAVTGFEEDEIVQAIHLKPDQTWENITDRACAIIREDRQEARELDRHHRSFAPSRRTHL